MKAKLSIVFFFLLGICTGQTDHVIDSMNIPKLKQNDFRIPVGTYNGAEVGFMNLDPYLSTTWHGLDIPHSSVKPVVGSQFVYPGFPIHLARTKSADREAYTTRTFLFPIINALGAMEVSSLGNSSSARAGTGVGLTSHFSDKLYLRAMVMANYYQRSLGLDNRNGILPNTYLWSENGNSRNEIQPFFRLSYTPNKFFNFQAGIDHNFIGEGQRSMLLSDFSAPYPFVQIRSTLWKFQFVNLYQFLREREGNQWKSKFASTHYLNFQATKRFQIGLFESVVFQPRDTLLNRGYEWEYLNPFLFYRPTEYSIGSQDRILLGTNFSYNFGPIMAYGQFLIDDFVLGELMSRSRWWSNKYAGQIGFKGKGRLSRNTTMTYSSEINFARPFTFSHVNQGTNWGHQGIPLGHPLGANFVESFSFVELTVKRKLRLRAEFMVAQQGGGDSNADFMYGEDIYRSYTERPYEYGYFIGGNGKLNRTRLTLEAAYMVFPKLQLEVFARPAVEWRTGVLNEQVFFVFGGIRTALWNERSLSY